MAMLLTMTKFLMKVVFYIRLVFEAWFQVSATNLKSTFSPNQFPIAFPCPMVVVLTKISSSRYIPPLSQDPRWSGGVRFFFFMFFISQNIVFIYFTVWVSIGVCDLTRHCLLAQSITWTICNYRRCRCQCSGQAGSRRGLVDSKTRMGIDHQKGFQQILGQDLHNYGKWAVVCLQSMLPSQTPIPVHSNEITFLTFQDQRAAHKRPDVYHRGEAPAILRGGSAEAASDYTKKSHVFRLK